MTHPMAPLIARIDPTEYPESPRGDVVERLHGVDVADPYRWLEDADSPATERWVRAQSEFTADYLASIPLREAFESRLEHLWDYERFGLPERKGGRYFFTRNDGLQNQSVIHVADSTHEPGRVLLDPNTLSADGTVSVAGYAPSRDGRWFAYALSDGGSDWRTVKVLNVDTGEQTADEVRWVKFSGISWSSDNRGFYYSRYPEPTSDTELQGANANQKLYYHRLGTPQATDRLVYERPDESTWGFGAQVTEDGDYLVIHVWRGSSSENNVFYQALRPQGGTPSAQAENPPVVELLTGFTANYSFVGNQGSTFWFMTDDAAPRGRLVAIDIARAAPSDWREVIPEADEKLESVSRVGDHFVAVYLRDAHTEARVFTLGGTLARTVGLPGLGSASGFEGTVDSSETFYAFSGFTTPTVIYRYDVATGEASVFREPKVDFDPSAFTTEQVFFASRDGTRVPMFLTYRKGLVRDGNNPVYLYGYGGFNVSLTPQFSLSAVTWMEHGGVHAVVNLRGGGEYGEEWHEAGTKERKQNVFDDFIAAAEWLIAEDYTRPSRLAIAGGSNGGLLVGACLLQRPDLFGCCVASVGVMDMLRFHKFTIGWAWQSDYGSPDDPEEFKALYAYSPLHNIEPNRCYPTTLLTTADRDDRVVPAHSFKFAAALQSAQACSNPILIRIESRAGHGAGTPTKKLIDDISDRYAFIARALGMEDPSGHDPR
ncbi:MAG: prolyl oligopeptidase family protein [Planctomycetota bacterium]